MNLLLASRVVKISKNMTQIFGELYEFVDDIKLKNWLDSQEQRIEIGICFSYNISQYGDMYIEVCLQKSDSGVVYLETILNRDVHTRTILSNVSLEMINKIITPKS